MSQRVFENRTVLVTGGSRGIGRAVCEALAEGGARVAINFQKNEQAAHEALAAVEKRTERAVVVQADVSREDHVERMVAAVRKKLGPIDLLVNNAGIAGNVDHDQLSFESWKRMFEVNVNGPFLVTWAVKDEMIERRFGRIVALLHDSTAARVGALFQLLVQDTTAQDFGLPSSAIRLRM